MKFTQFFGFGPCGAALAVLLLFSNAHCVLSKESGKGVEGVLSNTIEMEIIQLSKESWESIQEFNTMDVNIKQETIQDIKDVALLDCNASDAKCLSTRTKELLKVEAKFREHIARLRSSREKILTKYKNEVDRKIRELDDIILGEDIDSLALGEQVEDLYVLWWAEADEYIYGLKASVHTEADCDIDGLSDDMSEREWETLMDNFKAIVNLAYVFFDIDHIFLDEEVEDLPNRRNLRLRRRLLRSSSSCSACSSGGAGVSAPEEGVSPFNKFVNDYLAAFITSMYTTHLENDTPLNVNCTFD
eukprot:scaffold41219_cov56-Attheya_sp.AAC.1